MVLLESLSLDLGEELKPFDLANANTEADYLNGAKVSDKDLTKDFTLVAFICNHCPYVHKIAADFAQLAISEKYRLEVVAISANDPDYRSEDGFDKMPAFAKEYGFTFPYLFDETQEVAKAYQAVCTPDLYLFHKRKLVYHARLEDMVKAMDEVEEHGVVQLHQLPSIGCSIKWF